MSGRRNQANRPGLVADGASPRLGPTPRAAVSCSIPQGRKAARVGELCRVHGGPLHVVRGVHRRRVEARYRLSGPLVRVQWWSPRSPSIAGTGPRRSPTSSARTTSPPRCGRRWRPTGSTTPTSSPVREAAARPPRPGSWPARSTACRRRWPTPVASARAARTWRAEGPGSIDVIEIDAASHGGVDDARDLREKAFFAPVQEPLQGLHHRRGPHGHDAGLQRPAQARRGAAAAPALHLRHDRAGEGHPDHPLAHPPLPVPADPAAAAGVLPLRDLRARGRHDRAGGAAADRAGRRRVGARLAVGPRPAARRGRPRRRHPRPRHRPARLHARPRCSTTWSTRSPPATARPSSAWSTG